MGTAHPKSRSPLLWRSQRAAFSAAAAEGRQVTLRNKDLGGGAWSATAHDLGWGAGVT